MERVSFVRAIIAQGGKVLMLQQAERGEEAEFMLPGGHVEAGESPVDAMQREVFEETGLVVVASELIGIFPKSDKPHDIFLYRVLSCTGRLVLNDESLGWAWIDAQDDDLVRNMSVRERYAGLVRDARGWEIETNWSGENYLLTE